MDKQRKPVPEHVKQKIRADWKTGTFSKVGLAQLYDVNVSSLTPILKGVSVDQDMSDAIDNVISTVIEKGEFMPMGFSAKERSAVLNAARREVSFMVTLEDDLVNAMKMATTTINGLYNSGEATMIDFLRYTDTATKIRDSMGYRKLTEIKDELEAVERENEGKSNVRIVFD